MEKTNVTNAELSSLRSITEKLYDLQIVDALRAMSDLEFIQDDVMSTIEREKFIFPIGTGNRMIRAIEIPCDAWDRIAAIANSFPVGSAQKTILQGLLGVAELSKGIPIVLVPTRRLCTFQRTSSISKVVYADMSKAAPNKQVNITFKDAANNALISPAAANILMDSTGSGRHEFTIPSTYISNKMKVNIKQTLATENQYGTHNAIIHEEEHVITIV